MSRQKNLFLFPLSIAVITISSVFGGSTAKAGSAAVDIYCVMRDGGNTHQSSWQAAYISLKNERGGLFKISPKTESTRVEDSFLERPTFLKTASLSVDLVVVLSIRKLY